MLSPEEIERLASKTARAVGAARGHKAGCHSDVSDEGSAKSLQHQLVELRKKPTADAVS